ncbi:hypothetical protein SFRURICE_019581 [Spodoptera frugiperda]|nr:hypothetical protein SFRURICE_019581 [Spodoptera frugiperda]
MWKQYALKIRNKFNYSIDLKAIFFYRLIFGLYYKLEAPFIVCIFARIYCVIIVSVCLYYLFDSFAVRTIMPVFIYYMIVSIDIGGNVLFSLYAEEVNTMNFFNKLLQQFKLSYNNVFIYLFLIAQLIIICISLQENNTGFNFISHIWGHGSAPAKSSKKKAARPKTTEYLTKTFIEYVKCENMSDEEKTTHLKTFLKDYEKLVHILDTIIVEIKFKILFSLISDVTKMITALYFTISVNAWVSIVISWYVQVFLHLCMTCAPIVSMEITFNDLDEFKSILVKELLVYKDHNLRSTLFETIKYIELITTKYYLWNQYPINLKLVFGVFNLNCLCFESNFDYVFEIFVDGMVSNDCTVGAVAGQLAAADNWDAGLFGFNALKRQLLRSTQYICFVGSGLSCAV